jgi:hypothetical protein
MATTAGFSLTNDIMGKMNKNFFNQFLFYFNILETQVKK